MTQTGLPPGDLEKIAAFLDHRLPEEERREFLDRLDSDEALYEVFVETVRYREEASRASSNAPTNVVEHPSSKDWTRWMGPAAIAAMLALVVAGPMVLRNSGSQAEFAVALVRDEGLEGSLGERWYDQGWTTFRGPAPSREEQVAAFRSGVRALELEVALRLGRRQEATELARDLQIELHEIQLFDYPSLFEVVSKQLNQGAGGDKLDGILRQFLKADSRVSESLGGSAPSYSFGKWTETGRLAAQSGNERLLGGRDFRGALREVRTQEWTPLIKEQLDQIALQIEPLGRGLDLESLEASFQAIIDSH
jgi:hypothetical protein